VTAHAVESEQTVSSSASAGWRLDFKDCSEHFRYLDWNDNVTDELWNVRYTKMTACMKHAESLARQAGFGRPAAMSGLHVPTAIVPTQSEELPHLPPLYFVLPMWDMVVSNRVRLFGSYDHQELDVLLRLTSPGDAVVDVGANVGAVTVPLAAHVGERGVVHAFEPFRQVFQYLNANVAANGLSNVYTYHTALSDADAPPSLTVPAPSLRAGQNVGMYGVFAAGSTTPNKQTSEVRERMELVTVRMLDSFELPRVDLIKIDVEGHAAHVLAGSVATLQAHRPILWFEDGGSSAPETLLKPELRYWCTKLTETTEVQFICVPRERHAEVQQKLIA